MHADGPFEVTDISPDGIHFRIQKPEWMAYQVDDNFTIKAVRAIQDTEPLANCAAQGELEHQGGLRARRSRGGKTLNLAIWANTM